MARAAAQAYLGELDEQAVAAAAADVRVPGRMQIVGHQPLTLLDGAHNPDGIVALAESLPEIARSTRTAEGKLVAVVSILDDKNASDMLSTIARNCDAIVLTASQSPRALPPPTLMSLLEQTGAAVAAEVVSTPHAALERARQLAGPGGVVVATGSIYLIADLASDPAAIGARRASML